MLSPHIALTFLFPSRACDWTLPHPSVSAGAMSLDMIGSRPSASYPDWLPHRSDGPDWSHFRSMFYPNPGHIQGLQPSKRVMQGLWLFCFSLWAGLGACACQTALIEPCFHLRFSFLSGRWTWLWTGVGVAFLANTLDLHLRALSCQHCGRVRVTLRVSVFTVTWYFKLIIIPFKQRQQVRYEAGIRTCLIKTQQYL